MRVIAGEAKGTRLHSAPDGTRPLADRAREGLFSSLGGEVVGARCLDLYAGTGAIGIEALSRGAESCVFVDASRGAIRAIQANLIKTKLLDRARVVHQDALRALDRESDPFDLAFADPPYATQERDLRPVLERLVDLISPGGAFVLTRSKRSAIDVIPIHWGVRKLLTYGDARILLCREGDRP